VNSVQGYKQRLVEEAAENNFLDALLDALKKEGKLQEFIEARDEITGRSIMHSLAKFKGNELSGLLKTFIEEHKCDVNVKDVKGYTPLSLAVKFNNHKFLKILHEEYKVDLTEVSNKGLGLIHLSLKGRKL
jgi:ankyrin repeat protein